MKIASLLVVSLMLCEASAAQTRRLKAKKDKKMKGGKKDKGKKSKKGIDTCGMPVKKPMDGPNPCAGKKVYLPDKDCMIDDVVDALGQAGADVTKGYVGDLDMGDVVPVTIPYWQQGICPVNVHWHLGAEHRSEGEYDEIIGKGPAEEHDDHNGDNHRGLAEDARLGLRCGHYDEKDTKFTQEYKWKHCIGMQVGETYEVHWPHSLAGDCGTVNQFQTPFYDGVFCNVERLGDLSKLPEMVGVQAQVFTIVNDEEYYFPNLMNGMIVDPSLDMGIEITKYTGSTTGTKRDNTICSQYAPITWQVDRKCHMVSASTFDKMCADMKMQRDDMSDDLHAHGAREVVADHLASDNHVNRKLNFVY
jgi:hypothetical protein